jgi:hypothetical protein
LVTTCAILIIVGDLKCGPMFMYMLETSNLITIHIIFTTFWIDTKYIGVHNLCNPMVHICRLGFLQAPMEMRRFQAYCLMMMYISSY